MRLGYVIGKATLGLSDPAFKGGRFLVVQPFSCEQFGGAPMLPVAKGSTVVVYDGVGAGEGQIIGFTEGAEAAAAFASSTPVDAYACAIIDRITYTPATRS